jgi:HEAT repeat protein
MGPAAITELVPWLKSEKAAERVLATSIIGEMTPAPPETKGILSPMLNDPDASVRTKAAIALNIIDPTFADTVPAHIKTIQRGIWDSDTAAAVKALRGLGPKAKTAKEALTTLLKKSDDNLKDKTTGRGAAAGALNAVDPRRNGMTGLLWDLKQKDSLLRYRAAYALSEMPAAEASGALSDLIKAMDDGDLFVRARAVVAAARIGFDKSERLKPQLAKKAGQALNTISDERVAGFSETVRAAMNISPPKADDDDSAERHDAPAPTAP